MDSIDAGSANADWHVREIVQCPEGTSRWLRGECRWYLVALPRTGVARQDRRSHEEGLRLNPHLIRCHPSCRNKLSPIIPLAQTKMHERPEERGGRGDRRRAA